jgi:hypothetical protein
VSSFLLLVRDLAVLKVPYLKLKDQPNGLYYKHVMIVNYASSGVNKLRALLNYEARVVIYDHHMFIVQATGFVRLAYVCP